MTQVPTVGRIVHYRLSDADAAAIRSLPTVHLNPVQAGQVCAAVIVRVWGDTPESAVNLQVLLDGLGTYWATSRCQGDGDGSWSWPPRA